MNFTSLLYKIQQDSSSSDVAPETIVIPTSQKLYEVDLSTRTISGPETLSVQSDHYAETDESEVGLVGGEKESDIPTEVIE